MPIVDGAEPAGHTATYYVVYDDGTAGLIKVTGGHEPPQLARPGTLVPATRYGARLEELTADHAAYVAQLQAADEVRTRQDYEALLGAGVPEENARRMSGHMASEADGPHSGDG
ncbi:hypothetical protein [Streptomyces milbemycinicus]|uniref:hypothetical protein n=1 Tax=Streptomyces milbemycinicus TaxID=476552 RepID=UPI000A3779D6|nr:hypothetical protein [Streptomyces milbemycinicus]